MPRLMAVSDDDDVCVERWQVGGEEFMVLSVPVPKASGLAGLTSAEQEVVVLVARGATNTEVAQRRGTSKSTVANQLQTIFRKLGVSSRQQLAAAVIKGESERA